MTDYVRETIDVIKANAAVQSTTILWGDPGTGKTAFVHALGEIMDYDVYVINGASREPTDFLGNPATGHSESGIPVTEIYKPAWFVRIIESDRPSIVFLDELTTANASVQAAMLTPIQDRAIDNIKFRDDTIIISAANDDDVAADGTMLSGPMANRICHFDWNPPVEDFINGIITNWGKGAPAEEVDTRSQVATFLHLHQELIHDMPDNDIDRAKAWPSRRTWDKATQAMVYASSPIAKQKIMRGFVGEAATVQYFHWLENSYDIPDPNEVLLEKEYPDWSEQDNAYAYRVVMSCFAALSSDVEKYGEGFSDLLVNLADTQHRDVGASMVQRFLWVINGSGHGGAGMLQKLFAPYEELIAESGIR